jgi:hypothetical protein
MGDVPPLTVHLKKSCDMIKSQTIDNVVHTQLLTGTPGTKKFDVTCSRADSGVCANVWNTFWQGDADYIDEYIQIGDAAESSYDIFKTTDADKTGNVLTVDTFLKGYITGVKLQWCDAATTDDTLMWVNTIKDGSLDISIYPAYRGDTAAAVVPFVSILFSICSVFVQYFYQYYFGPL